MQWRRHNMEFEVEKGRLDEDTETSEKDRCKGN